jgi:hypothetical protein
MIYVYMYCISLGAGVQVIREGNFMNFTSFDQLKYDLIDWTGEEVCE